VVGGVLPTDGRRDPVETRLDGLDPHPGSVLPGQPAARAKEINATIVEDALAHGGTCTGEHGIGLGEIDYLECEHGDLLPLMRGIKNLLDPSGILNPGKVLASGPARTAARSAGQPSVLERALEWKRPVELDAEAGTIECRCP
jgi:hypothetical protein